MDNFKKIFKEAIEEEPKLGPILRLVIKATTDRYVCVVEGKTDQEFYKNTCINILKESEYVLWRRRKIKEDPLIIVGKESVIDLYKYLKGNQQLCKYLKSCIFIVDHDFDGVSSRFYEIDKSDRRCINMTPYHSVESFYVEEENLGKILNELGIKTENIKDIFSCLKDLAIKTTEYFALKGTITYSYNNFEKGLCRKVRYTPVHTNEDIFGTPKRITINEMHLSQETNNMYKTILTQRVLLNKYQELKRWINGEPVYIQGHFAYDYLSYIINEICGLDFENIIFKQKELIELLDIKMKIATGNGKLLKAAIV